LNITEFAQGLGIDERDLFLSLHYERALINDFLTMHRGFVRD